MKFPFGLLALPVLLGAVGPAAAGNPGDSVVKVYASIRTPDLTRPWNKQNAFESLGSGVVIEGRQILTNAHVALYASEIFVQGKEGDEKVEAKLKAIAPGIDLALLTVESKDFFAKRPALPRSNTLPQVRDTVEVYGYPIGGANQSVTKGIVSRIEFVPYNSRTLGLRVQIDAALNPGNSGGPALVGNQMIGLAFSRFALGIASNIGYIIPNEEIDTFLAGRAVKPQLKALFQPLQNETLRKKLGLDEKTEGILTIKPTDPLQAFDVLTHLGPHALDNQGHVKVSDNLRFHFEYVIPRLARDGKVPATVIRDGQTVRLQLPVTSDDNLVLRELQGEYPAYFLYGPLVFSAASMNSAAQFARLGDFDLTNPLLKRQNDKVRFPGEELVVVTAPMLRHKCVRGYADPVGRVVAEINGIKVKNLRHLVEVLRDCRDEYVTFRFAGERAEVLVLNNKEMAAVTQEVMEENAIPHRGSPELVKAWEQQQGDAGVGRGNAASNAPGGR